MAHQNPTLKKVKLHDLIVGLLYLISVVLAIQIDFSFIYIAAAVAVLQIISPVTGFCPVYFVLNKIIPGGETIQNGPGGTTAG